MASLALQADSACVTTITPAAIRVEMVRRIDAAANRERDLAGMPHALTFVGAYLASIGFDDEPCRGERFYQTGFPFYRSLAHEAPATADKGRETLFIGRRPWFSGATLADDMGAVLDRMLAAQMSAYPDDWSEADKRDSAAKHLLFAGAR